MCSILKLSFFSCPGNYDVLQQPKNISELSEKTVCFYMFVDEVTEAYMRNTTTLNSDNRAGIWRVVVVHNLPYTDARRNGKVCYCLSSIFLCSENNDISKPSSYAFLMM